MTVRPSPNDHQSANGRAERAVFFFLQTGFMQGHQANGAFVACGPPGFTALALINLGSQAREMFASDPFLRRPHFPARGY